MFDAASDAGAWLKDLNPEQLRAATASADRPLLILAGAGSGKTTTLSARVAWLIAEGVRPERILLLTFTRRAAAAMIPAHGRCSSRPMPPRAPRSSRARSTRSGGAWFASTLSRLACRRA